VRGDDAQEFGNLPRGLRDRMRPRVAWVVVRGDRATAGLLATRYSGEPVPHVQLVREHGRWLLVPRAREWEGDAATECVIERMRTLPAEWGRYEDRLVVEFMERYCDRLDAHGFLVEREPSEEQQDAVAELVWQEMCDEGKFSERDRRRQV
jgi:hypothetical protein